MENLASIIIAVVAIGGVVAAAWRIYAMRKDLDDLLSLVPLWISRELVTERTALKDPSRMPTDSDLVVCERVFCQVEVPGKYFELLKGNANYLRGRLPLRFVFLFFAVWLFMFVLGVMALYFSLDPADFEGKDFALSVAWLSAPTLIAAVVVGFAYFLVIRFTVRREVRTLLREAGIADVDRLSNQEMRQRVVALISAEDHHKFRELD